MNIESESHLDLATLDPPGSIAVIGAGPLGMEAALYGRFLGYNVTVFEASGIASSLGGELSPESETLQENEPKPIPMLPDRCLSPLALSAVRAQFPDLLLVLPTTIGEWVERVWLPLAETDLLRGRVSVPANVTKVGLVDVQPEESEGDSDEDESVPPDFQLTFLTEDASEQSAPFEAVIVATGTSDKLETTFERPPAGTPDYWFEIGRNSSGSAESDFLFGLKEIVGLYAGLAGRDDLDLYRPTRD